MEIADIIQRYIVLQQHILHLKLTILKNQVFSLLYNSYTKILMDEEVHLMQIMYYSKASQKMKN